MPPASPSYPWRARRARRWLRPLGIGCAVALAIGLVAGLAVWIWWRAQFLDSGGPQRPAQAAYDVRRYELVIAIDPDEKRITGEGASIVTARAPIDRFEIQLDGHLAVSRATVDGSEAPFTHEDGLVTVRLPEAWQAQERHRVVLAYGGRPKIAARPPWLDGLVFEETPAGEPWLGVTVQGDGADDWWPCKDHPSDEPDEGLSLALTLPAGIVGLSNGRKVGESANPDGTVTTRWEVSYPINNYLVTFNAGPYVPIESPYERADGGGTETLTFWALPEHVEQARALWKQMPGMLAFLERRFGPFPFWRDKFAVVEAPYLGMEHQTLVAYGGDFTDDAAGFDDLLLHEVAHEWWGNSVTAADWADFWIHEGFATYAEALYVLDTQDEKAYLDYMARLERRVDNREPIVAGRDKTSAEAYIGDIYMKGACVLHSLKWLVGDEAFFTALRRFATDERFAYGLVSTADFEALVAEVAGEAYPWFFDRYLERADLPAWTLTRTQSGEGRERVSLAWDDPAFAMPLPVEVAGKIRRVEMPGGHADLEVAAGAALRVDPEGRLLDRPAAE